MLRVAWCDIFKTRPNQLPHFWVYITNLPFHFLFHWIVLSLLLSGSWHWLNTCKIKPVECLVIFVRFQIFQNNKAWSTLACKQAHIGAQVCVAKLSAYSPDSFRPDCFPLCCSRTWLKGETEPARRLGLLCTIKSVAQQNKVAIKGVAVITTQHGFLKRANI